MLQSVTNAESTDPNAICDALARKIEQVLFQSNNQRALQNMVHQQARFDPIGIEDLAKIWHDVTRTNLSDANDPNKATPMARALFTPPTLQDFTSMLSYSDLGTRIGPLALRHALLAYLLSATLKDASLFLEVQPSARLRWVDLDPKPITKFPGYVTADQAVHECFQDWLECAK